MSEATANRGFSRMLGVLLVVVATVDAQQADGPENLLRLAGARQVRASAPTRPGPLTGLTDGDKQTTVTAPARTDWPLDVVYGFAGDTVAPERLVIHLPAPQKHVGTARVEVLVSTLSDATGFRSLRSDPIPRGKRSLSLRLPAAAARWILVRMHPPRQVERIAVCELEILGRRGPPRSQYAFKESPAKAVEVLARLESRVGGQGGLAADEVSLMKDAKDGKLDQWTFAEAALVASGVVNARERKRYLAHLTRLEKDARNAVAKTPSVFGKGERLLTWLHQHALQKGYVHKQTDLSVLLDTQTFNCVSSAVIYNVLGRRLGLDVRAIEVPDHALSILYDGTEHADVETTTPKGFNPARDRATLALFEKQTGFRYIPDRARDRRRELDTAKLVAAIYYNRGVSFTELQDYRRALLSYFKALSLDPESATAVKNVLAALANWSTHLSKTGGFAEAIKVVSTGLELAPEDATLLHNRRVIWGQWAQSEIEATHRKEALAILERAAAAVPDGGFLEMQSWVFIQEGQALLDKGAFRQALAVASPGFKVLSPQPKRILRDWCADLYVRWANGELDQARYGATWSVLDEASRAHPEDKRYPRMLAYLTQEWSEAIHGAEGPANAEALLRDLVSKKPKSEEVRQAARAYVQRRVIESGKAARHAEALATAERCRSMIGEAADADRLLRSVHDSWADHFRRQNDWAAVLGVYEKAIQRLPKDPHLTRNAIASWDSWARTFIDKKDWAGAVKIYEKAVAHIPNAGLRNNLEYCRKKLADQ